MLKHNMHRTWKVGITALLCIVAATTAIAQDIDKDSGLLTDYLAALQSAKYTVEELGVQIIFDGAGPGNNILIKRNGHGDDLVITEIIAWFDTRENAGPNDGEVIHFVPLRDGTLDTSLLQSRIGTGEQYGLDDTVIFSGIWKKAMDAGERISPDALLLAQFELNGESYEIRNSQLIEYIAAQGVQGLPEDTEKDKSETSVD